MYNEVTTHCFFPLAEIFFIRYLKTKTARYVRKRVLVKEKQLKKHMIHNPRFIIFIVSTWNTVQSS